MNERRLDRYRSRWLSVGVTKKRESDTTRSGEGRSMRHRRVGACRNPKREGRSLDESSIRASFLRSPGICAPPCWTSG